MTPLGSILVGIASTALLVSAQARADATIVFLQGDVRDDGVPVTQGGRILSGSTLTTGPGAQAYLAFPDRQKVVLHQDTAFRVAEFHYSAHVPKSDRATFDLLYGAVRLISGVIGARNPGVVALRTPQATFSVHGTDFIVAVPNWAYLKVLRGGVSVTNSVGSVIFGENTAAVVTSDAAIARPVFAAALPPAASGPISSLAQAPAEAVTQANASRAAGAATGAVRGLSIDGGAAIRIGIYAALVSAALRGSGATTHH